MKTTLEANPRASERTAAQVHVEKSSSDLPTRESLVAPEPLHCTNVPNDPILEALTDVARDWASARDLDQLRSALIRLLGMTN